MIYGYFYFYFFIFLQTTISFMAVKSHGIVPNCTQIYLGLSIIVPGSISGQEQNNNSYKSYV